MYRFKLRGRQRDEDLYKKMVERMTRGAAYRESTKTLLKLFERGIGFHHPGLGAVERGAVEILFRLMFHNLCVRYLCIFY